MASCDDDFTILGDEAQAHHALPQQQLQHPQASASMAVPAAGVLSFPTHRYVSRAAVPIRTHPLGTIGMKKNPSSNPQGSVGESEHQEGYGEAFATTNVSPHSRCFVDEVPGSNPFDHGHAPEDEDANGDNNPERKSHGTASVSHFHNHHHQQYHVSRIESMRRERDELSDDESPYGYNTGNKRSRSSSAAPSSSGDYRKDREEWSDSAIGYLLDAYTEKYVQLNRGNLRGRDWEDVATTVSERCEKQKSGKTVEQCKNKVDNLKKRYKVECQRLSSGNIAASHWPWFKKMEQVVGSSSSSKAVADDEKPAVLVDSTSALRQLKRYSGTSPGSGNLTSNFKLKSLSSPRWKRTVLKISGAALAGSPQNVDSKLMMLIAREVAMASRVGVEVAIVVGCRNIFCGDTWVSATGTDRTTAYQIGMMASTMNAVLLQALFEKIGVETRVQTSFSMQEVADPYVRRRAIRQLEKGRVVIFGGIGTGTGNPLLTTDAAAAIRASEINADALLKGNTTDGVYDYSAFEHISFRELVARGFTAMDMTAVSICEENNIPVVLFNLLEPGNISRALCGDQVGTLIDQSGRIS